MLEGLRVGPCEGAPVVEDMLGSKEGTRVGLLLLGIIVGAVEGPSDEGLKVGATVGVELVGICDGFWLLGIVVGLIVGVVVGVYCILMAPSPTVVATE